MVDGYSRFDIQMIMVNALYTLKEVLNGNRPGKFKETTLNEIKRIADCYDSNGLNDLMKESESYDSNQLRTILELCRKWMSLLGLEFPQPIDASIYNELGPQYENAGSTQVSYLSNLVIDVDEEQDLLPADENGNNYWLLTDDGYLEFHGGGYLQNSHGEIMSTYKGSKAIGKQYIQGGLTTILETAMEEAELTDEYVIGLMAEAGLRFRTNNPDNIHDMDSWYWDLRENLSENEVRRIKLPDEVVEYYRQFEPKWEISGEFGKDYTGQRNGSVKYHLGVDWVLRMNNKNETTKVNIHSVSDGKVVVAQKVEQTGLGKWISIKTDKEDYYIQYMHLSEVKVSSGEDVKKGDIIGIAGFSGLGSKNPADAHLHIAKCYTNEDIVLQDGFSLFKQSDYDEGKEMTSSSAIQNVKRDDGKIKDLKSAIYVKPPTPIISINMD
jgi:murein DD-endopeptidase MepM/ murein hydrolase activator NlpD